MCLTGKTGQTVTSLVGVVLRQDPEKSRAKCQMKQQQCPLQRQEHATPKFVVGWMLYKSCHGTLFSIKNIQDVNCEMGEWAEWAECSVSCGGGLQSRFRPIDIEPLGNGTECESSVETQECNINECSKLTFSKLVILSYLLIY